jgi:hypothetical protein
METNITATLIPYIEVPNPSLMMWLQGFEDKPHNLQVVQVSHEKGPILHAFFSKIDDSFLLTGVLFEPSSSDEDVRLAGNALNLFLAEYAQLRGATKLYGVKPQTGGKECEVLRHYAPRIAQVNDLQAPSHTTYLN